MLCGNLNSVFSDKRNWWELEDKLNLMNKLESKQ
jgi:hypothetical protein